MKNRKNFKHKKTTQPLVTVHHEECHGDAEKMVRKFIKKVKREGILDECRERRYFKKPTVIKTEKKRNKKRLINKVNAQRDALSDPRGYLKSKRGRK
jgi:ribosomal protein S21